jgi:hypothetical protein
MQFNFTGWGATENSTKYPVLQKAFVPEYDSMECEQKFAEKIPKIKITSGQVCAGGEGKTKILNKLMQLMSLNVVICFIIFHRQN